MARKLKSDKVLFITTILLVALSVVMVYSASAAVALDRYGSASRFLITQGMWAALGVAMLYVVMRIDYRCYREPVFIWTCLALVSLGLIAVYFRAPINGARRWLGVGTQVHDLSQLVHHRYRSGESWYPAVGLDPRTAAQLQAWRRGHLVVSR